MLSSLVVVLSTLQSRQVTEDTFYSVARRPANESSSTATAGSTIEANVKIFFIDPTTAAQVPIIVSHVGVHEPSDYFGKFVRSPIRPQREHAVASKLDAPFNYTIGLGTGEVGENGVITGWDAASVGIRAGERRLVTILPADGYRSGGYPSYFNLGRRFPHVPEDATLVIDITCLEITCARDECREPLAWPPSLPMVRM